MTHTHTCEDCGSDTHEPHILNVAHPLVDTRTVCADCNDDYTSCPECGVDVHGDDACPMGEPDDVGSYLIYGCAPCAGYRLTAYGWVKEE